MKFARKRRQRNIESKIIDLITGYVNESKETIEQLSADQIRVIKDILKEMEISFSTPFDWMCTMAEHCNLFPV